MWYRVIFLKKHKEKQQKSNWTSKKENIYNSDLPKIYTSTYYARKQSVLEQTLWE